MYLSQIHLNESKLTFTKHFQLYYNSWLTNYMLQDVPEIFSEKSCLVQFKYVRNGKSIINGIS